MITAARRTKAKGGCQLGSLVGQLAESDPEARALIAAGFDQWAAAIGDGLRSLHADGKLPSDIDPDDLATTLLATLQGGLLLAQVQQSPRPFETAVNTLLALASADEPKAGSFTAIAEVGPNEFSLPGPNDTNPNSHKGWTSYRVPSQSP